MKPSGSIEARVSTGTAGNSGATTAGHALQRFVPFAWRTELLLIAVHVAFSQAEPVKHMLNNDGPQVLCGLYHHANCVERLPVCKT